MTAEQAAVRAARVRVARRVVTLAVGAVLAYFAISLIVNNFDEVLGAADLIGRPRFGWLILAIAAEISSYLTYAAAQRQLLGRKRGDAGLPRLTLLAVCAQALGVCIPAGWAWANVFSYRVLRRWRLDEVTTGRLLFVTAALYVAALAVLAVIGAEIAGGSGPASEVRVIAYVLLGMLTLVFVAALLRPRFLRRAVLASARAIERRTERGAHGTSRVERLRGELRRARGFSRGALVAAGGWLLAAWIGDIACLVCAFLAIGSAPPWRGLMLAYCAGQLAALLPFTPGGLGVVEGSLTFALVSYGGGQQRTLAAVLLYRLISFWGLIPSGAACYAMLRGRRLRGTVEAQA